VAEAARQQGDQTQTQAPLGGRAGHREHRMGRNLLAHATGDAINAVLAGVGYDFKRLLA